jgi:hypothetical protein
MRGKFLHCWRVVNQWNFEWYSRAEITTKITDDKKKK